MSAPLLHTRRSAADMLGLTETRIDELRRAGKLIAVREGRRYLYRTADLEDFVNNLPTWEPLP